MKNIIHVESVVRVILGELDNEGNVVNKTPLDFQLEKLTPEIFANLIKAVEEKKSVMAAA